MMSVCMGIINSRGFWFLRLFFRAFALVGLGLACLVVIGSTVSCNHDGVTRRTRSVSVSSSSSFKNRAVLDKDELLHSDLNLAYLMSARKVPNGPDPIHNRRARNSGRPPGQD